MFTIGVNPVETYIREGRYSALPSLPFTPGSDVAGVIDEVGDKVTKFKVSRKCDYQGCANGYPKEKSIRCHYGFYTGSRTKVFGRNKWR